MTERLVTLCCIEYRMTVCEGVVTFDESRTMHGRFSLMSFERFDVGAAPGPWGLVMSSSGTRFHASHIVAAYELLCTEFGDDFGIKKVKNENHESQS